MIKIPVLGLGSIGLRHAKNLASLGIKVRGYDPDPERCKVANQDGIEATTDREAVFVEASAVVIASPSGCHYNDLEEALDRNLHVFAEKPLAHTDIDLPRVLEAFEKRKLVVFAGFNLRYHPAVIAAQKVISAGNLGDILWARFQMSDYLPNWRPHTDYRQGYANDPVSGGVLFDIIHEFDMANALLGPAQTIAASARNTGSLELASEDCADVFLKHKSNVVSSIHVDFVTRPRSRQFEVAGTLGRMRVDLDTRSLTFIDIHGREERELFGGDASDDYICEAKDFVRCIETGSKPACDGLEALGILRQVLMARQLAELPQQ